MDFKDATDRLIAGRPLTVAGIAEAFGVEPNTIHRARMSGENARNPPRDWEPVLARLAREQAQALAEQSRDLERLAAELERQAAA
jgi:hypothetical protein